MWSDVWGSGMALVSCRECGKQISNLAELCSDCGSVALPHVEVTEAKRQEGAAADPAALREYRWMQVLGAAVVVAGIAAAVADSPIASVLAIAIGLGTFAIGLLGAWRHINIHGK
jgi:hypothetical protein